MTTTIVILTYMYSKDNGSGYGQKRLAARDMLWMIFFNN